MANNNNNQYHPEEVTIPISPSNEQSPKWGLQKNEFDAKPTNFPSQSPEIASFIPSPKKPPIHPNPGSPLIKREASKKIRFGEPSIPLDTQTLENLGGSPEYLNQFSPNDEEGPDEMEIYRRVSSEVSGKKNNRRRMSVKIVVGLLAFLCILSCLVVSLYVKGFQGKLLFGVLVWRWLALLLVIFPGMLVTSWFVHCVVFLIEWKFLLKKHVVYFSHALKTNGVVFLWISGVLVTWMLLFIHEPENGPKVSVKTSKILDSITWTLVTLLIGSFVWLVKTTWIKKLESSYHLDRFFDRIQETVFYQYVLQTLSGKPVLELARQLNRADCQDSQVSFRERTGDHREKKAVDWKKLHRIRQERVPSWTMKLLVDVISNSGLLTMSSILNQDVVEGGIALDDDEITCEEEAIATAVRIFYNVAGDKDELYIDRNDLIRFMILEEVDLVYPCLQVNEQGQVDVRAFSKWVVEKYKQRLEVVSTLKASRKLFQKVDNGVSVLLFLITFAIWLMVVSAKTRSFVYVFGTVIVGSAFIFGESLKKAFDNILFVFVVHPFDIGDCCLIGDTPVIIKEVKVLTTTATTLDGETRLYPNLHLSGQIIRNYTRNNEEISDFIEFPMERNKSVTEIDNVKQKIESYIDMNSVTLSFMWKRRWVMEFQDMSIIKMRLYFQHSIDHNSREKQDIKNRLILQINEIINDQTTDK